MIKPITWVVWVITAILVASLTRNPLYQLVLFLILNIVMMITKPRGYQSPISVYKFSVIILVFSTIFNFLISHFGSTVLFILPGWLPLLGGNLTLEALVYGLINGLALVNMLFTFNIFNQVLSTKQLINLIPRPFFPLTLVLTISLTLIPSTRRQFDQVKEAQAIRGHQMKKLRDWLPLFLPLLIGGMEHAYQLAESMTSRGFSQPMDGKFTLERTGILLGAFVLFLGLMMTFFIESEFLSTAIMVAGGAGFLASFFSIDRKLRVQKTRIENISPADIITLISLFGLVLIALIDIPGINLATLNYNPYPVLTVPGFDFWIGGSLILFMLPGIFTGISTSHD